jgi:hypothetical protein
MLRDVKEKRRPSMLVALATAAGVVVVMLVAIWLIYVALLVVGMSGFD